MTHVDAHKAATAALADLPPPVASFASDNWAGAHPSVLDAMVAANVGHVPAYGDDRWTAALEDRVADLFGAPVTTTLCFGGTGANVVALHTLCGPGSRIVCTAGAHIAIHEAGAAERITGAPLVGYPWVDGKLTPDHVRDAAARLPAARHTVSVTQATETGTVYTVDELAAVCDAAHAAGMVVHVDGARLPNALVAWGYGPDRLAGACRALAATGVDVVGFGGTKSGMVGAEALVFCNPSVAGPVAERRQQVTQRSSKTRFLAAQFLAGLEDGALLDWAGRANAAARRLATAIGSNSQGPPAVPGVALHYPVDSNGVFVALPPAAAEALDDWTPFHYWDPAVHLIRFIAAWDTTDADVDRLAAGIRAATAAALATGGDPARPPRPDPGRDQR